MSNKTSSNPKVSIITYVFVNHGNNRLKLFQENLDSVAKQKYCSYEHVIIDDGSVVNIEPLIKMYPNTVYVRKEQSGITASSNTFNKALESASGEYVAILSSDDLHVDDSIEIMAQALDENPSWQAVTGAAIYSVDDEVKQVFLPSNDATVNNLAEYGCFINGCAIMFRKSVFKKIGMPPHFAASAADFDLWLRVAHIGPIGYISNIVVDYRDHSDSTRKKTAMPRQLKPKLYEYGYYNYHKSARIMFVISSALKRQVTIKSSSKPAKLHGSQVYIGNQKYGLELREFLKLKPYLKAIRNTQFKTKYLREVISQEYLSVLKKISDTGGIVYDSVNPVSVVLSHFLSPEVKQTLNLQDDYRCSYYTEYFNWGFLDKINAEDEDVKFLALEGMVNKDQNCNYIDGIEYKAKKSY